MNINEVLSQSPVMSGPFPSFDDRTFSSPLSHFQEWFKCAVAKEVLEPRSMVLTTYDQTHLVDSRVLVIKAMDDEGFFIESGKGRTKVEQLKENSHVAMNFYWREQGRQIRLQGKAVEVESEDFKHVRDYLDANTRDLAVYKVIPDRMEFYQALEQGGYERMLYTKENNKWLTSWL